LASNGFIKGDQYLAAHSLGTVMAQMYIQSNHETAGFKAQFLMGGGIMRQHRTNNNDTGLTSFDNFIPTMTIVGTKDGLYRITRGAEGYWHGVQNIIPSQSG
jgi:hypothetical protein